MNLKEILKITIPINPTTKKNSQRIVRTKNGTPLIIQSERYKQFENDCKYFINCKPKINKPINIKYTFYRKDNRLCDINGLIQAMDDILVKYNVIEDDNYKIVVGHDYTRVYTDKDNPRIEVEITEI